MKPHRLAVLLLGFLWISCSTSEENPPPEPDTGIETTYNLILAGQSALSFQAMTANALDVASPNPPTPLPYTGTVSLIHRDANRLLLLLNEAECAYSLSLHEEYGSEEEYPDVFSAGIACSQTPIALALSPQAVFLSYSIPGTGIKEEHYFLKALTRADGAETFPDTELDHQPLEMVASGSRIFILTYDPSTGNNGLEVRNAATGTKILINDLGTDVLTILKNPAGQIIVSYENRHLILDPLSLEVLSRVQYIDGREPGFGNSTSFTFDAGGRLYYPMEGTPTHQTSVGSLSAIYDFAAHTAYLYFYENFLSVEQIGKYKIGATRTVAFDHRNGLLLIGYEKLGDPNKGGLIRIKPVPEPAFIDQTDLEGVPLVLHAP